MKKSTKYLYEGLTESHKKSLFLWESAGLKLIEANLTVDQINQIFAAVEQGATASGSNRTLIGKGKDAASAVNKAWEDLKTKIQNSGPIKNVDAMYDQAAEKLKQATGGDTGVMKYVQKYRDFAQKYPVAQSFIYAALIAAAGISGAGLGGAAALGLFKMADKLLQGEKFSSAAYQGAKTGALAYGASKLGDLIKGQQSPTPGSNTGQMDTNYDNYVTANPNTTIGPGEFAARASGRITDPMSYDKAYNFYIQKFAQDPNNPSAMTIQAAKKFAASKAKVSESIKLSESQINLIFENVSDTVLLEGIADFVKGAANWAATKGKNLTTKITADKLQQAWKKSGSPTDSDQVSDVLRSAGVSDEIISKAYSDVGIKTDTPATTTADSSPSKEETPTTGETPPAKTPPTTGETPPAETPPAAGPTVMKAAEIVKDLDDFWKKATADQGSETSSPQVQAQIRAMAKQAGLTGQTIKENKVGYYSKFLKKNI